MVQIGNPAVKYYVQMVTSTSVNLINETEGKSTPANLFSVGSPPAVAYFNSINFKLNTTLLTSSVPWTVTFVPSSGTYSFGPLSGNVNTWANATVNVRNLNTAASAIQAIEVDGIFLNNSWFAVNSNGSLLPIPYNLESNHLYLAEKADLNVHLNLAYLSIPTSGGLQIQLESTSGNFFPTFYGAPTAVIKESVASENLLIATRNVPEFDGSGSAGGNGSFIQSYIWKIDVPTVGWKNWSDTSHIVGAHTSGQIFQ